MTEPRPHLESVDQPSVHHEESDVNVRAIFGFAAGLLVTTLVVSVAVWLMPSARSFLSSRRCKITQIMEEVAGACPALILAVFRNGLETRRRSDTTVRTYGLLGGGHVEPRSVPALRR